MTLFARAPRIAVEPDSSALATGARARLREAHGARDEARRAFEESVGATNRVQLLIHAADQADAEAVHAAAAAADATRRWAVAGARGDVPSGDQALVDAAAEAQRRALQARLRADGARAGLPEVAAAESAAREGLEAAEGRVSEAAMGVICAEAIEPRLRAIEAAAADLRAASSLIGAFFWLSRHRGYGVRGVEGLRQRFRACTPVSSVLGELRTAEDAPTGMIANKLADRFRPLADYAERLRSDSDARLE